MRNWSYVWRFLSQPPSPHLLVRCYLASAAGCCLWAGPWAAARIGGWALTLCFPRFSRFIHVGASKGSCPNRGGGVSPSPRPFASVPSVSMLATMIHT